MPNNVATPNHRGLYKQSSTEVAARSKFTIGLELAHYNIVITSRFLKIYSTLSKASGKAHTLENLLLSHGTQWTMYVATHAMDTPSLELVRLSPSHVHKMFF